MDEQIDDRFVEDELAPAFLTLTGPDGLPIELDPSQAEVVA